MHLILCASLAPPACCCAEKLSIGRLSTRTLRAHAPRRPADAASFMRAALELLAFAPAAYEATHKPMMAAQLQQASSNASGLGAQAPAPPAALQLSA